MKVQPGRRLVQNEQRVVARLLGQLGRQLHPLRLAAAKGCALLAQLEVAQADFRKRRARVANLGERAKKCHRLVHGHVEHVGDVAALVVDLKRLAVVAPAVARLAGHVHRRQKVHFDFQHTSALAFFATPALDVEAEPAGTVAAYLRCRQPGEQIADLVEDAGVCCRVAARRAADRRLIHNDHPAQRLLAAQCLEFSRTVLRAVKLAEQRPSQHVVNQRAFARTADAGHARERPQRNLQVNVLQIILHRADDLEKTACRIRTNTLGWNIDFVVAAQIFRRQRFFMGEHPLQRPGGHHFAAIQPGARPHVDDVIGPANRLLVVLDHQHRVAQVAQSLERGE